MAQKHNSYTEQPMTRDGRIQGPSRRYRRLRHPSFPATEWATKNPLLQRGEIGIEIDTHKAKVGDGTTYWNNLPYSFTAEIEWGSIVGDIQDQTDLVDLVTDAVDAEATARENADTDLQDNINTVAGDLATEITDRTDADTALQNQITANKNTMDGHIADTSNPHQVTKSQVGLDNVDNTSDLDKPISTATQTALDGKVDKVSTNRQLYGTTISTGEQTTIAYTTATTQNTIVQREAGGHILVPQTPGAINHATSKRYVDASVATETTNRENADVALQTQIDAIVAKSDVVDIVGTYAELQVYDTSGLGNNDVVKVISDSTHNNAPSYYRWVITGGVGAWVYIGSESETYTKAETDALLNTKQDVLTAGANIQINGTTISATDTTYTAGTGISIDANNVISNTQTSAEWGNISGTLSDQTDLQTALDGKVNDTGDTMTGVLAFTNTGGISLQGTGNYTQTITATGSTTAFKFASTCSSSSYIQMDLGNKSIYPSSNGSGHLGQSYYHWQDAYINTVYTATINNGGAITVPATSGTMALTSDIPSVGDGTITITQGGTTKGTFTTNQSGNTTIDVDAGGNVDIDNSTITKNGSDELQAVAVINQQDGTTPIKTWKGTQAQYDAIAVKDPDTIYYTDSAQTGGLPAGTIISYAGQTVPDGFLLCDGAAVSRTTYSDLFAAIGTEYGSGDGSTTFNLPNTYNKVPMMLGSGYNVDATNKSYLGYLPNVVGEFYSGAECVSAGGTTNNAFYLGNNPYRGQASGGNNNHVKFAASRSSATYGRDGLTYNNVIPAAVQTKLIIKY